MKFTPEQNRAIEEDGQNILISAGAGSGKTAVLTQRVIRKLRQGVNLDSLIILTFTNAAAAEMKRRIKDKILEESSLFPQLKRLDNAIISTFDSFCLRLIQTHHSLLGLPSRIGIADPLTMEKTKNAILDSVILHSYEQPTSAFSRTLSRLFDKGDAVVKEGVKALIRGLETIPERHEYLEQYANRFHSQESINVVLADFYDILDQLRHDMVRQYRVMMTALSGVYDERVLRFLREIEVGFAPILTFSNLDEAILAANSVTYPRLPTFKKEDDLGISVKAVSEPLKEAFGRFIAVLKPLFLTSRTDILISLAETQERVMTIVEIAKTYLEALEAAQREEHLFQFGDIMELAIGLLEEYPSVREQYRQTINEIMVDEYQDTNDLQDRLLALLDHDNLFMVGDVKQSIYGFRNANPKNFMRKYAQYQVGQGGLLITLNQNFRSRKSVLDGINVFFDSIMDRQIGGVDYRDNQALRYGNEEYDLAVGTTQYGPKILSYSLKEDEKRDSRQIEGTMIAADIASKLATSYEVYDAKAKALRPMRYSDVAIIVDRKSGFAQYESALVSAGIPLYVQSDESFVASTEIRLFENVLRLMKAMTDSDGFSNGFGPAFYGVARSFVYEIEDNSIIDFLLSHRKASRKTTLQDLKHEPFTQLAIDLESLLPRMDSLPIDELILSITKQLKLSAHLFKLNDPSNVEAKLDFLVKAAASWPKCDFDGLLEYFRLVNESDELDIEYQKPPVSDQNAVWLLSMHKSKGLEFPICYFPGLDKKFNFTENKGIFIFSRRYGLITKAWNDGFYETILHALHKRDSYVDYVSERLRLFYVAMTRTKEQFNLLLDVTTPKDIRLEYNDAGVVEATIRQRYKKYTDLINTVPASLAWQKTTQPVLSIQVNKNDKDKMISIDTPLVFRQFHFEPILVQRHRFSKHVMNLRDDVTKADIEFGTAMHRQLECFDWLHPESMLSQLEPFLSQSIRKLLETEPFAHLSNSVVRQEYPFIDALGNRGVIDLIVDDGITLHVIDFKLKNIEDEAYILQLKAYANFLTNSLHRPVKTYLYSLKDAQLKPIGGTQHA